MLITYLSFGSIVASFFAMCIATYLVWFHSRCPNESRVVISLMAVLVGLVTMGVGFKMEIF